MSGSTTACQERTHARMQHEHGHGDITMGFPQCPNCGSYDVLRQTHITKVYFTCRRCGTVFS